MTSDHRFWTHNNRANWPAGFAATLLVVLISAGCCTTPLMMIALFGIGFMGTNDPHANWLGLAVLSYGGTVLTGLILVARDSCGDRGARVVRNVLVTFALISSAAAGIAYLLAERAPMRGPMLTHAAITVLIVLAAHWLVRASTKPGQAKPLPPWPRRRWDSMHPPYAGEGAGPAPKDPQRA